MKQRKQLRLGDLLVNVGKITDEQLQLALEVQREKRIKLGEVLKELGLITGKDIVEVLEFQLGIPQVDLDKYTVEQEVTNIISEEFARKHSVIPIKRVDNVLTVAMSDPLNIILINDLEIMTGLLVQPMIATDDNIKSAVDKYYSKRVAEKAVEEFTKEFNITEEQIDESLLKEINNAPVVRLVNTILLQAAQNRASDIHIEPEEDALRIRFRIDGDLQDVMQPAKETHGAIITRIKIMAKLDISEKRKPQDGRVEVNLKGRELDLRVSSIPTIYGEKIVMRMLDRSRFLKTKEELGLSKEDQNLFEDILKTKHGIILITGPTGAGKSTTLYTMLSEVNDDKHNVMTIEDPVEYRMKGIVQSQVNTKAGFTFASGLRSFLRQDPDIIMVGEIRDNETAEIATRAAITGHLVLSTLHTNSAAATINRLIDMGIEPYLVASSVVAILAQALVKRLCPSCKLPYIASESEMALLEDTEGPVTLYKPIGCSRCNQTGYSGRRAVYEIMRMDSNSRKMIIEGRPTDDIRVYHMLNGMQTLAESCKEALFLGETSVDEYLRLTYTLEV